MKVDSVLTQTTSSVELALSRSPNGVEKPVDGEGLKTPPKPASVPGAVDAAEAQQKKNGNGVSSAPEGLTKVPSDPEVMKQLAERIKDFIKENRSIVDIALDKDLEVIVTKVLEQESGDVIRQFPPESMLQVMKRLRDMRGVFLNEKG